VLALWRSIRVANRRFNASTSAYRILKALKRSEDADKIAAELERLWPHVLVDWVRADYGYCLVRDIATADRELATSWLKKVSTDRQLAKIPSRSLTNVVYLTVRLAITSYAALAPENCERDNPDFSRLAFLIKSVPVPEYQMILWCDLGIKLHYSGKLGMTKMICGEFVQPVLHLDDPENESVRDKLIETAAPFLYLTYPQAAALLLEQIKDPGQKDNARHLICKTIFRKRPVNEPYKDPENCEYEIDGNDAATILAVLKEINTDSIVFGIVEDLCASVSSKKNNARIRRTQARDVLSNLEDVIAQKFPDRRNIKHDGYKIAALAQVTRAKAALDSVRVTEWEKLFEAAKEISNVADRVVVMTIVGTCAKGRGTFADLRWFNEVKTDLKKIPSGFDRFDRYSWVAKLMARINKQQATSLVKEAMSLSTVMDDGTPDSERQKKLLDLAQSIDPELVDKIIDVSDQDEAKVATKEAHAARYKLKERAKELAADPCSKELFELSHEELAEICGENFASIASGRLPPHPVESFQQLTAAASSMPMPLAFPVWSWVLENAIRRRKHRLKGEKTVESIFEASTHAAELTLALIGKSQQSLHEGGDSDGGLIMPGGRDQLFEMIRQWASKEDGHTIRISDPYFGPDDLELLRCIAEVAPRAEIRILTSKQHLNVVIKDGGYEDAFYNAWAGLCDLPPPRTEVVVTGLATDGSHPIHDRWIVTEFSGLRLGGSTNSMGCIRLSEVSQMDVDASGEKCRLIDPLLNRERREWYGVRLSATSFYVG
jgi:hypothetical protein